MNQVSVVVGRSFEQNRTLAGQDTLLLMFDLHSGLRRRLTFTKPCSSFPSPRLKSFSFESLLRPSSSPFSLLQWLTSPSSPLPPLRARSETWTEVPVTHADIMKPCAFGTISHFTFSSFAWHLHGITGIFNKDRDSVPWVRTGSSLTQAGCLRRNSFCKWWVHWSMFPMFALCTSHPSLATEIFRKQGPHFHNNWLGPKPMHT